MGNLAGRADPRHPIVTTQHILSKQAARPRACRLLAFRGLPMPSRFNRRGDKIERWRTRTAARASFTLPARRPWFAGRAIRPVAELLRAGNHLETLLGHTGIRRNPACAERTAICERMICTRRAPTRCAPMRRAPASPIWWWGFPVASIRASSPSCAPTCSAPITCTASCFPAPIPRSIPWTMPASWRTTWASQTRRRVHLRAVRGVRGGAARVRAAASFRALASENTQARCRTVVPHGAFQRATAGCS